MLKKHSNLKISVSLAVFVEGMYSRLNFKGIHCNVMICCFAVQSKVSGCALRFQSPGL